jgi:hypothetical protein
MLETLGNFIAWYGTIAVLGAFGLSMFGVIPFQGTMFYILNLSGAIALLVGNGFKRDFHWAIFFLIWGVITAIIYFKVF